MGEIDKQKLDDWITREPDFEEEDLPYIDGHSCIQCGYCCTVAPCTFGLWNLDLKSCEYLDKVNRYGQRKCKLYDVIRLKPEAYVCPSFGSGCSSPLHNNRRENVILAIKSKG